MILYGLLEVGGRHREGEHSFCIFYNTKEQSYYLGYEENEPSQEGENGYAFSDIKLVWDEGRNTVHMVTGGICKSKYDNIIVYEGKYQVMDSDSGIYEPFDEKENMLIELWKCMLRCIDYQGLNENGEDYVNWNENYNVELFLEGFTEYETNYQIQALYDQEKWLSHLIIGNADYSVWADTLRVDKGWEFNSISFIDRYRRYAQDAALFLYGSISKQICEERVEETEGQANCNLWGSALKGVGLYFYNNTGSIYGHLAGEIYLVDITRTHGTKEVVGEYIFALEGDDPVRMTLVYKGTDLTKYSVSYSDYANEMDELEGIAGMKFDLVTAKEK